MVDYDDLDEETFAQYERALDNELDIDLPDEEIPLPDRYILKKENNNK